jgi:hypothetical protein
MDQKITRRFFKPIKGTGELRREGERLASVSFYLQGWQDMLVAAGTEVPTEPTGRKLSGMEGEITLAVEDRIRVRAEQLLYQEFQLRTDKDAIFTLTPYKIKDGKPDNGCYGVRCKVD